MRKVVLRRSGGVFFFPCRNSSPGGMLGKKPGGEPDGTRFFFPELLIRLGPVPPQPPRVPQGNKKGPAFPPLSPGSATSTQRLSFFTSTAWCCLWRTLCLLWTLIVVVFLIMCL